MTDKHIVINGCNVIECNHFDMNFKHCDILGRLCREQNNCYYKQLKRKEQECDKLKKELFSFMNGDYCAEGCEKMNNAFRDAHKCILEEKEELKVLFKDLSYENQKLGYKIEEQTKQLEPFKDEYFKGLETIVIAELAKKSIRLTTENRKLENALDEIEEFCVVYSNDHDAYETVYKHILDIINKAKEEK